MRVATSNLIPEPFVQSTDFNLRHVLSAVETEPDLLNKIGQKKSLEKAVLGMRLGIINFLLPVHRKRHEPHTQISQLIPDAALLKSEVDAPKRSPDGTVHSCCRRILGPWTSLSGRPR